MQLIGCKGGGKHDQCRNNQSESQNAPHRKGQGLNVMAHITHEHKTRLKKLTHWKNSERGKLEKSARPESLDKIKVKLMLTPQRNVELKRFGCVQDLFGVARYFHLVPDLRNLALAIYQKSGALNAHIFFAVHALFNPDAIGLKHFLGFV